VTAAVKLLIVTRALKLPAVQLALSLAFFVATLLLFGRFCLNC
jgi:lipopolysaccharide export LptBFGC system permease protein LptF